jgi:hypothetical protein
MVTSWITILTSETAILGSSRHPRSKSSLWSRRRSHNSWTTAPSMLWAWCYDNNPSRQGHVHAIGYTFLYLATTLTLDPRAKVKRLPNTMHSMFPTSRHSSSTSTMMAIVHMMTHYSWCVLLVQANLCHEDETMIERTTRRLPCT